jgi:hypothetical protein
MSSKNKNPRAEKQYFFPNGKQGFFPEKTRGS